MVNDRQSGNCYKIKLLMSHLGLADEWIDLDLLKSETETAAGRSLHPNGNLPLLALPSGQDLSESNAILNYLAPGSRYLPEDPWAKAKVRQWQFFEQYRHEPYIAVTRFIAKYLGLPEARRAEFESKRRLGYKAIEVMEQQLLETPYLVGAEITIADISLYAYTHVAHEGGFELATYPAVQAWLDRVARHPRHVVMAQLVKG